MLKRSWPRFTNASVTGSGYPATHSPFTRPSSRASFHSACPRASVPGTGGRMARSSANSGFGEITIGIAMILGLFVGIAAFLGATLTVSFGLAGVAGVNPVFMIGEILLILAWRNAGYIGLDRYVLPALGTPWHKGKAFHHDEVQPAEHQLA